MGVGVSLVLIAIGAIFTFAITAAVPGVNLGAVGVIFMTIGTAGLMLSLLFWESYAPFSGWRRRRTIVDGPTTVVREPGVRESIVRDPIVRDVDVR